MARGYRTEYGNYPGTDPQIAPDPVINRVETPSPINSVQPAAGYNANTLTRDNWQMLPGYTSAKQTTTPAQPAGQSGDIPTMHDPAQAANENAQSWYELAGMYQANIDSLPDNKGSVGGKSWDDIMAEQALQGGQSGGGGYQYGQGYGPTGGHVPFDPSMIIAKPTAPTFDFTAEYDLPDYELPEEDKSVFKAAYADATTGYMKEVRNQAMQAIFSARSSQNPNERAMLVEAALSGAGKAYENIARAGNQYARSEQARQRAEQIAEYDKNWEAQANELEMKYRSDWEAAIMDFQSEQSQYQLDYSVYASQPADYRAAADKEATRPKTAIEKAREEAFKNK